MATTALSTSLPTMADLAKRMDPNGAIAQVVEALSKSTPIMEDIPWKEGNQSTGHLITSRTVLPSIGYRRFNEGVTPTKSSTDQYTETCGMMNAQSNVDVELAKLNGNAAQFRADEDSAFIQAFGIQAESDVFYKSEKTTPEAFTGLAPRLDTIAGNPYASQIVQSGVAGVGNDQTSVWLVVWGEKTVFGIYPKGTTAGVDMKDMDEQLVKDANNKSFRAYVTDFTMRLGLCVRDYRYVARLCNIDTGDVANTGKLLIEDLINLTYTVKDLTAGRPVLYMPRLIMKKLHQQAVDTTKNSTLSIEEIGGRKILHFLGIPIRMSDGILTTEAKIS